MLLISLLTVLCFHLFLLRINSFPSNVLFSRRYLWRRYENHRLFAGKKKPSTFTTHKNKKTFFSKKSFQKLQDLPPALRNKLSKPKQEEIAIKNKQELKNLEKQGTPFKPENKDKRQPVDLELEEATEKREESDGDEENQEEQEGGGEEGPSVKEFLKSATNEEKETFRHALLNKFTEWKVLSQNGFLEKISNCGKLYQEDIERFDREKKKALKLHLTDSNTDEDNNEEEEEEEAEEDHHEEDYEGEEEEENEEESIGSTEGENPNDQPGGGDLLDALLNYAVHSLSPPPNDTTSSLIVNNVADEEENPDQNQLIKKFQSLKKDVAKDRVDSNLISKKKKKDAEQRERERETAFKQQLNNNIHELSAQQIAFLVTQNDEYILNKFTGASSAFPLSASTTTSTITTTKEKKETKPTIKKNEVFYYNLLLEIKDKRLVISFPTLQKVLLGLVRLKEKDIQSTTKYTRFLYQAIQLYQQLRQQRLIAYPVETAVIDNGNSNTKKGDQTMPRFIFPEERQHQQQGEQKKKKSRNYEEAEESFHYSFLRAVYLFNPYNQTINEEIVSLLFPSLNPTTTSNSSTAPIISSDYRHLHVGLAKALGRFQHSASSSYSSSSKDQLQQEISEFLHQQVYSYLPIYSIEEMNDLLRVIGKLGFHFEIFQLFEKLKSIQHFSQYASYYQQSSQQYQIILEKMAKENHWDSSILSSLSSSSSSSSANTVESIWRKLKINAETIEYFISSFLLQMMKEEKCLTMKDLPNFRKQESEVIVLGRSNVGKSSLINALLNRKNLAKVSAIPGHTQAFHFYTLQRRLGWNESSPASNHEKDPQTIPPTGRTATATTSSSPSSSSVFRLVDVPGLGYADTVDEEIQLQWKELIIRYLTKRDHCKLVFHLVDSRHLLTKVDQEIIRIAAKASKQRLKEGKSSYQFVIVLTKVDKYKFNPFSTTAKRSTVPRDGGGTSSIRENPVNEDIIQQIQQEIEDLWSETIYSTKQKSQIRKIEDEEMSHTDKLFDQIIQEEDDGKTELSHRDYHSNNQLKQMEVKVIQTSSLQKTGLDSLWKQILAIC